MFRKFNKKSTIAALSVVAALAMAAGAYAYFTSSGSGTGTAAVGNSSPFTVNVSSATGGPLLPGATSGSGSAVTIPFTVTNGSSGYQNLSSVTAALAANGNGDITHSGTAVTGCKASWFTVTPNPPTLGNMAGNATTAQGTVSVTMQDSGTNQNACEGATPDVNINAS